MALIVFMKTLYLSQVLLVFCMQTFAQNTDDTVECGGDAIWQPTIDAWQEAGVDSWLGTWWNNTRANSNASFASDLASDFGEQRTDFTCGIGEFSRCSSSGCKVYYEAYEDPEPFLALQAITKLNTLFNDISTGLSNGQQNFLGLEGQIIDNFIEPYHEPDTFNPLLLLAGPLVTAVAAFAAPFLGPIGGTFVSGGAGVLSQGLSEVFKDSGDEISTIPPINASALGAYATRYFQAARADLEGWAADTFKGNQDLDNHTIIDYMGNGSFMSRELAKAADIEQFYKQQMVSRAIQSAWQQYKPFISVYPQDNPCRDQITDDVPHYFNQDFCIQYVLRTAESVNDEYPWGWWNLESSDYNITIQKVILSSHRSWQVARGNYSADIALTRLMEKVTSANATASVGTGGNQSYLQAIITDETLPFIEGAAFEGTWQIPVCDTTMYPCSRNDITKRDYTRDLCCGGDCSDTDIFAEQIDYANTGYKLRGSITSAPGLNPMFRGCNIDASLNAATELRAPSVWGMLLLLSCCMFHFFT